MLEHVMWPYRLTRIEALLAEERSLLEHGDISRLAALGDRRASLIDGLGEMPDVLARQQMARLQRIQAAARRNGRLIGAYLEGARQAAARIQALENSERSLGTYGRDGARPAVAASGGVQRRA
ncbi:MAG: hypothetical protein AAGI70_04465 [Pseudomonadota bacterium]